MIYLVEAEGGMEDVVFDLSTHDPVRLLGKTGL